MGTYYTDTDTGTTYTADTVAFYNQPPTLYTEEELTKIIIDKHLIWPGVCPDCGGVVRIWCSSDYCGCFAITCNGCGNQYIDISLCKSGHNDYYFKMDCSVMLSKQHALFVRTLKELKDALNRDINGYLMYKKYLFNNSRCGITCSECGIPGLYKICQQYLPHLTNRKDKIDVIKFIIEHLEYTLKSAILNGECCGDHAV